jgi:hypothetical protein
MACDWNSTDEFSSRHTACGQLDATFLCTVVFKVGSIYLCTFNIDAELPIRSLLVECLFGSATTLPIEAFALAWVLVDIHAFQQ